MNKPIRHGEALLLPVDKLPEGKLTTAKSYIIAHSETGHHHVVESRKAFHALIDHKSKELYIELSVAGNLVHQKTEDKHRTLVVPAGKYLVIAKNEYNPFDEVIQAVQD